MTSAPPAAATSDVAQRIPERVSDATGDFSSGTYPQASQVSTLIAEIVQEVQTEVGTNVDSSLASLATLVVSLGAAAQVELGYFSNQAPDNESKYTWLQQRYEASLVRLARAQAQINQGVTVGQSTQEDPTVFVVPNSTQRRFDMTRLDEKY